MTNEAKGGGAAAEFMVIQRSQGAYWFEVHRAGCADLSRKSRRALDDGPGYPIMGADVEAAIAADVAGYQDCEQDFTREHYHVLPCATSVKA